jgi:hypothetical protein
MLPFVQSRPNTVSLSVPFPIPILPSAIHPASALDTPATLLMKPLLQMFLISELVIPR